MNEKLISFFNRLFPKRFTGIITLGETNSHFDLIEKQIFSSTTVFSQTVPSKNIQDQLSQWVEKPESLILAILFEEPDITTTQVFLPPGLDDESMGKAVFRELNIESHPVDVIQYRLLQRGDFEDTIEVAIAHETVFNRMNAVLGSWQKQVVYIGSSEHLPDKKQLTGDTGKALDYFSLPLNHADVEQTRDLKKAGRRFVIQPVMQIVAVFQLTVLIVISVMTLSTCFSLDKATAQFKLKQAGFHMVQQLKKEQHKLMGDLAVYDKIAAQKSTIAFMLYELEKALSNAVIFTSLQMVKNEQEYKAVIAGQTTSEPELYRMLEQLKENPVVMTVNLNKIARQKKEYAQFNMEMTFY